MFTPRINRKVKQDNPNDFGKERYDFLKQLIHEYTTTTSQECRRQTLANLANFAYDPINYEFMKQLHLVDLFIGELSNDDEDLVHFALSGLCNISCDPESREYIISLNGIKRISEFLLHKHEDIALDALTTLYYLFESKNKVSPKNLERKVQQFTVGQIVSISRKISQKDVETFTELSGDTNPIHSSGGQEKAIIHGALLNALVSAVIGTKLPGAGTVVVQQTLNFPNKCYVDETVTVQVKLAELRKIITVDFSCEVEDQKKVVLYGQAKVIQK